MRIKLSNNKNNNKCSNLLFKETNSNNRVCKEDLFLLSSSKEPNFLDKMILWYRDNLSSSYSLVGYRQDQRALRVRINLWEDRKSMD